MHDIVNLLQVILPFVSGFLAWRLTSKKSERDYIKEENDRLLSMIDSLTKENDKLRKELSKR